MMDPAHFFASLFASRHPNSGEIPSPHPPVRGAAPSPGPGRILPFRMAQWSSVMTASTTVHPLGVTYAAETISALTGQRVKPLHHGAARGNANETSS